MIDNTTNGFTLYHLENAEPIRTYTTNPPSIPIAKQVAFGEDWKVVVGGSDNGLVYIFDRCTGMQLDALCHTTTLVQTITVSWNAEQSLWSLTYHIDTRCWWAMHHCLRVSSCRPQERSCQHLDP